MGMVLRCEQGAAMKMLRLFVLLLVLFLASCAHRISLEPAHIFHDGEPIEVEFKSFSFEPNHIVVLGNQSPITLVLRNTDDVRHNFTLIAPDGTFILSKDLEPKESATVSVESLRSGKNYVFYCSFHRYRGMEGMLMLD